MICSNCNAANRADAKFCGECGVPFAAACPACGTPNEAGRKFCYECGSPLAGAAPPTRTVAAAREAPAAERRLVSVVFADLVGFTTLSESRDSEEVRELLSRYFELARTLTGTDPAGKRLRLHRATECTSLSRGSRRPKVNLGWQDRATCEGAAADGAAGIGLSPLPPAAGDVQPSHSSS